MSLLDELDTKHAPPTTAPAPPASTPSVLDQLDAAHAPVMPAVTPVASPLPANPSTQPSLLDTLDAQTKPVRDIRPAGMLSRILGDGGPVDYGVKNPPPPMPSMNPPPDWQEQMPPTPDAEIQPDGGMLVGGPVALRKLSPGYVAPPLPPPSGRLPYQMPTGQQEQSLGQDVRNVPGYLAGAAAQHAANIGEYAASAVDPHKDDELADWNQIDRRAAVAPLREWGAREQANHPIQSSLVKAPVDVAQTLAAGAAGSVVGGPVGGAMAIGAQMASERYGTVYQQLRAQGYDDARAHDMATDEAAGAFAVGAATYPVYGGKTIAGAALRGATATGIQDVARGKIHEHVTGEKYDASELPAKMIAGGVIAGGAHGVSALYQKIANRWAPSEMQPGTSGARSPSQSAAEMSEVEARASIGLPPHGPLDEAAIRKAYFRTAAKTHPDVQGGSADAFERTAEAARVLRERYATPAAPESPAREKPREPAAPESPLDRMDRENRPPQAKEPSAEDSRNYVPGRKNQGQTDAGSVLDQIDERSRPTSAAPSPDVTPRRGQTGTPESQSIQFSTAKGSVYEWSDGTTQRTKSLHEGHDPEDVGLKERSTRTVFVSPEDAREIGMHMTLDAEADPRVQITEGGIVLTSKHGQGYVKRASKHVPFVTEPEIGKSPVEFFGDRGVHAGNPITSIQAAPSAATQPPTPTIRPASDHPVAPISDAAALQPGASTPISEKSGPPNTNSKSFLDQLDAKHAAGAKPPEAPTPANQSNERIAAAAFRTPAGKVYQGTWHGAAIEDVKAGEGISHDRAVSMLDSGELADGFVTSSGRFVDRAEAAKIAAHSDQFKPGKENDIAYAGALRGLSSPAPRPAPPTHDRPEPTKSVLDQLDEATRPGAQISGAKGTDDVTIPTGAADERSPQPEILAGSVPRARIAPARRVGQDGAGPLAGKPAGIDKVSSEQRPVVAGDAGSAGGRDRALRDAGESGVRPEGSKGDRTEGVHPARAAGEAGPERSGRGSGEPDRSVHENAGKHFGQPQALAGNYIIPDAEALHAGGIKQKFRNNVNAIEALRKIEGEGRGATPDEQRILAGFVGWGAMPGAFNKYGADAGDWTKDRDEIASLLTPEEFDAASKSTLNAHYTSGPIVTGMWEIARRLGFNGGRILEPSLGIGNFFGLMPPELRGNSALTGVELDKLTGRMAKLLYPQANVLVHGFEALKTPNGFFDFVTSNFPFGDYRVHDKAYNKFGAPIHDYFFLKSLDQVRPGGIVSAITSTGTLDKLDPRIRKAISAKADLVAAIRLPEGAFQKNAGTAVVTDLIILKRRAEGTPPGGPAWTAIKTVADPDGASPIPINEYFVNHPEQVLGEIDRKSRLYGKGQPHVSATPDFQQRWNAAIARVPEGTYEPRVIPASVAKTPTIAPDTVKEGGFVRQSDGTIKRRHKGELVDAAITPKQKQIIESVLRVRDAMRRVVNAQVEGKPETEIKAARKVLNQEYDGFVKKHGPLNASENVKAFKADPDAPVVLALEKWDAKTKTASKSDAFTKNTVRGVERAEKASSGSEAIGISLNETGRVDLSRIASLLSTTEDAAGRQLVKDGLAFDDPASGWRSAEQYLSGNVVRKLEEAKQAAKLDQKYKPNVTALEKVQPADVPYDEIDARLGVPWVGTADVASFAAELFSGKPESIAVKYLPSSGEWLADWSSRGMNTHRGTPQDIQIFGTSRAPFMDVLEAALNNKVITVRDKIDEKTTVINKEESAAANAKVDELQQRFRDWIWQDDARRARLHRTYNDTFNNIAPERYDGSHLKFPGMSPEITLRTHQANAVWRTISKGTAQYAHEVGTGKTYTMVAAGMELRRLGLANKPGIAVLKATLPGFVREARELYPNAKILAVDKFEAANRKAMISRIATGDWDLVILTHDHIDMLPMRKETQQGFIQSELDELENVIREAQESDGGSGKKKSGNRLVKKLEKAKARLESRLKEALDSKQDDAITFEETGIDHLFVDESHKYKSLPVYTKQDRVKGIPHSRSDRATQMWMRTRWLQQMNNGRGVVFATGTPITNTMAELYTTMRYLQGRDLAERGIEAFDAWARNFGIITTRMEYGVTGEYAPVSRFSRFVNMPELARIAGQVIDVQRAKDMPNFTRPKRRDEIVTVPMTASQRSYLQEIRQRAVEAKKKRPGEPGDNMLSISTDARKAALDMRLVDAGADASDSGKVEKVVQNLLSIWRENPTKTQMVFSDIGIHATKWGYSPFQEIIDRLVKAGIPQDKIINFSTLSDVQKRTASRRLKDGEALVGLGSTDKMGTGVNAQTYLYALHHMDVPWLPGYVEQRDGRGWRQGNTNAHIKIIRYTTEGSFDTFMWQTVDSKGRFIQQFIESMSSGKQIDRQVADEDTEELSAAQIMAVTSGNPLLLDKINLDRDVNELDSGARRHERNTLRLRDTAASYERRAEQYRTEIANINADLTAIHAAPDTSGETFRIELGGTSYTDRDAASEALAEIRPTEDWKQIGAFRGLPLSLRKHFGGDAQLRLGKEIESKATLLSLEYAARPSNVKSYLSRVQERLTTIENDIATSRVESTKPYPRAAELASKKKQLGDVVRKMTEQAAPKDQPAATDSPPGATLYSNPLHFLADFVEGPVVSAVKVPVKAGAEGANALVNTFIRSLTDRVRNKGTPSAKVVADRADAAVNSAKAALGMLSTSLDRAMTLAGGGLSLGRHRAAMKLQSITRPRGKDYGISRIVDAVEGRITAGKLSASENALVSAIVDLTDKLGKMYEANGHQQMDPRTGTWRPFKNRGGHIFVRHPTPDMFDILMKGAGKAWDTAIDAFADLNGLPRANVEQVFQQQREQLTGEGPDASFRRINAEFGRVLPRVPTHLYVNGDLVPLFKTHPFSYVKTLAENGAARVGFVKHFGQEIGPSNPIAKIRQQYMAENGETDSLVQLVRALNNIPVTRPNLAPGTAMAQMLRAYNNVSGIVKAGMLTMSTIQNLAEPLGNLQAFSGGADMLKAVWRLSTHPKATLATLETMGAITKDVADLTFKPGRPMETAARFIRESSGRVFLHRYINELQEKLAGVIALEKVERMKKGKGTSGDSFDLRSMGFDARDALRMIRGKGTTAEYNRVIRKAPTMYVGSPISGAERARVEHNRIYRAAFAFTGYTQMKMRTFAKQLETYAKIAQETRGGTKSFADARRFAAAHEKLARYIFGTAASGALGAFLLALATGGMLGLDIALHEAKDRPARFIWNSFIYTMLSGPYGAIMRQTTEGRNSGWRSLADMTLPGFLFDEMYRAVSGSDNYRGLDAMERAGTFLGRIAPVNRMFATTAAAFGFGESKHDMDTSVRAYWRWRMDEKPPDSMIAGARPEQQQRFSVDMKRVYLALRNGNTTAAEKNLKDALGVAVELNPDKSSLQNRTKVADAIRQRKLLPDLDATERDALRARIGVHAFQILEQHDELLERWSEHELYGVNPEDAGSMAKVHDRRQELGRLKADGKATGEQLYELDKLNEATRDMNAARADQKFTGDQKHERIINEALQGLGQPPIDFGDKAATPHERLLHDRIQKMRSQDAVKFLEILPADQQRRLRGEVMIRIIDSKSLAPREMQELLRRVRATAPPSRDSVFAPR